MNKNKKFQIDPEFEQLYDEACALMRNKEFDKAIHLLKQLTEQLPELPQSYSHLGSIAWERGELEEANRYFRKVTALLPDSSLATICVFNTYWEMKKFEYALDEIRRFTKTGGKCSDYIEIVKELKEKNIMDDHFNLLREPTEEELQDTIEGE